MEAFVLQRTDFSKNFFWISLFITEFILACAVVLYPYYAVPLFILIAAVLLLFFYPESAYFLFLLSLMCHLFEFRIASAHSVPPRMWRIDIVPVDIVSLRSILSNSLVIIAALIWGFSRLAKARPSYPKTALDLPAVSFFIWFIITLSWTADLSTGLVVLFALSCCYLGFFLSVAVIKTKKTLNISLWLLIFVGLINAAVVAYSLHGEPLSKELFRSENVSLSFSFIHTARTRGMGFVYSPMTAYFLNVAILSALTMFLVSDNLKKRCILALIIFFMVYAHLATLSKGAILGLLAGLSFMVINCGALRKRLLTSVGIIAVTFIISAILVSISWPWPEKAQFLNERQSMAPRYIIWETGFEEFLGTHGFGFGGGAFFPAHDIFLQILYELGIPGLMFWLFLLLKLFISVRSVLSKQSIEPYYRTMIIGFSAGMTAILTVSLADSYYFEDTMWTFLGIGMAMINLANKNACRGERPTESFA